MNGKVMRIFRDFADDKKQAAKGDEIPKLVAVVTQFTRCDYVTRLIDHRSPSRFLLSMKSTAATHADRR